MQRKKELQWKIEAQQDQGFDGLFEEDQFLAKVNSLTAIRVPAGTNNSRPIGFLQ
jgi:hypothetical protein